MLMVVVKKDYEVMLKKLKQFSVKVFVGDCQEDSVYVVLLMFQVEFWMLEKYVGVNEKISQQCWDLWKVESQFVVLEEVV